MKSHIIAALFIVSGMSMTSHAFPTDTLTVHVLGTAEDARFEPSVIQVQPGDVIKFEVIAGLHTVTAYHPDNRRPQRIPEDAVPFDSGMLKAGDIWFLKPEVQGVYDYFCLPHERMGHAGRLLVGNVDSLPAYSDGRIPSTVTENLKRETQLILNQ